MKVIGIDPGEKSGGMAVIISGELAKSYSFSRYDEEGIYEIVREELFSTSSPDLCVIEIVHSFPRQGVVSSFSFGKNYGALKALAAISGVITADVEPGVWQRDLGCLTRGDKNVTKVFAQNLYPDHKITHGNADAILIARWGCFYGGKIL